MGGKNLLGRNNNNPPSVNPFGNLEGNNFNNLLPPSSPANLFRNLGEGNLSPNNNNLPPRGLDPNVVTLVNVLTRINLTGGHYLRKESFIKPTEFGETETEDLNEWLERFN